MGTSDPSDVFEWRFPETPERLRVSRRYRLILVAIVVVLVVAGVAGNEVRGTVAVAVIGAALFGLDLSATGRTRRFHLRITEQREVVVHDERQAVHSVASWGARTIQARGVVNSGVSVMTPSYRWVILVVSADGTAQEITLPAFAGRSALDEAEVAELVRQLRWWAGLVTREPPVAPVGIVDRVAPGTHAPGTSPEATRVSTAAASAPAGGVAPTPAGASRLVGVPLEWHHPQAESTRRGVRWTLGAFLVVIGGIGAAALVAGESIVAALLAMAVFGVPLALLVVPVVVLLTNVSRFAIRVDETGACSFLLGGSVRHTIARRGAVGVRVTEEAHDVTAGTGVHQHQRASSCAVLVTMADGSEVRQVISSAGGFARVPLPDQVQLEAELRARAGSSG